MNDKDKFKNFTNYMSYHPYDMEDGKYRCPVCMGSGTRIAPGSFCDPVEGYKDAERIPCPKCSGTGFVPPSVWSVKYLQEKKQWQTGEKFRKATARLVKQALAKLTVEEQEALGYYANKK